MLGKDDVVLLHLDCTWLMTDPVLPYKHTGPSLALQTVDGKMAVVDSDVLVCGALGSVVVDLVVVGWTCPVFLD